MSTLIPKRKNRERRREGERDREEKRPKKVLISYTVFLIKSVKV